MHVYVVFIRPHIRILFQTCQKSLISINIFCVNIVSLENKFETKVFLRKNLQGIEKLQNNCMVKLCNLFVMH